MEWNEKLQQIIDYVEQHLQRTEEPINPKEIAAIAGCSYDFFQKVFSYMNDISFSEYVRMRKLTLAGYDLKSTHMKVVDISYKYGYDSPTSFTKAFQLFHGFSPRAARQNKARLRVYPKMQVCLKQEYQWQLLEKDIMQMIGVTTVILPADDLQNQILAFWNQCQVNGIFTHLISIDEGNPKGLFGMTQFHDDDISYSIMAVSTKKPANGFQSFMIPKAVWAIFDCKGPAQQAIQQGWKYLNEEWLLKYPFRHADCPELEWYSNGNAYHQDYKSQIWIPILEDKIKER